MNHKEKMILIVEDSITQAAYLQGILNSEDYNTSVAHNGEDEKCFAAGCDGYISNPVNPSELLLKINAFLCA